MDIVRDDIKYHKENMPRLLGKKENDEKIIQYKMAVSLL